MAMSVKVRIPVSLPSFMTGRRFAFFEAMSFAASSMLAFSLMVITGLVMMCRAVTVSGARLSSTILVRISRSVMIPMGLSAWTTIIDPTSYLFMVATTSFMMVSLRTTLRSLDMMSRTRTIPAIFPRFSNNVRRFTLLVSYLLCRS